jgi:hypothetical protein
MKAAAIVVAGLIATLFVVLLIPNFLTLGTAQGADPPKTMVFERLADWTFGKAPPDARRD